ncbi:hypothetical protein P7H20_19185 [Paenibacillus larvae]|nr:hypothetical protein [Paenibacillus larvae]MDT2276525.1 hypothetical protein [Paenibacillus larvae]
MLDHRKRGNWQYRRRPTKRPNPGVPVKTSWDEDLFVDESFFQDLCSRSIRKSAVKKYRKLGTIDNELTRFRYDVMLRVNKKHAREENRRPSLFSKRADIHGRMCGTVRHVRIWSTFLKPGE